MWILRIDEISNFTVVGGEGGAIVIPVHRHRERIADGRSDQGTGTGRWEGNGFEGHPEDYESRSFSFSERPELPGKDSGSDSNEESEEREESVSSAEPDREESDREAGDSASEGNQFQRDHKKSKDHRNESDDACPGVPGQKFESLRKKAIKALCPRLDPLETLFKL